MKPDRVAQIVLSAIEDNLPYIFTSNDRLTEVEERLSMLARALRTASPAPRPWVLSGGCDPVST